MTSFVKQTLKWGDILAGLVDALLVLLLKVDTPSSINQFSPGLADALITLLFKVETPSSINQFSPISRCNVIYKVIIKVIVNRLKEVWGDLIPSTKQALCMGA